MDGKAGRFFDKAIVITLLDEEQDRCFFAVFRDGGSGAVGGARREAGGLADRGRRAVQWWLGAVAVTVTVE